MNPYVLDKAFDWVPKIYRFYNVTTTWRNVFLIPETFMLVFKWYVCYIDEFRWLFFLTFFRCFLCRGTPRSQTELEVTPCLQCVMGITNDVMWTRCKWIGSATRLEPRLVTWCLWTNGRIGCKNSWWTNQEELFCPLSRKTRHVHGCFILMHCRCQIMCVCSAAKIHSF